MRFSILYLFLAFLLASPGLAQVNSQKRVTLSFSKADLGEALKVVAREMGASLYLAPSVHGTVTIDLVDLPALDALGQILAAQEKKYDFLIHSNQTLVVGTPEQLVALGAAVALPQDGPIRMEFLLEDAPSAKVVDFLKVEYPRVEFTPHPTMNGFYARGSKDELLQIKRELSSLDRVPEPPAPPQREYLPVKYAAISEVRGLLSSMVPDVKYDLDTERNLLIVEGSPGAIDQVRELLSELGPTVERAEPVEPAKSVEAESYEAPEETGFRQVVKRPLSTFSIDVDTASYSNIRRFLKEGRLPPAQAVRIEEMVNYFSYDYPQPKGKEPFSLSSELSVCPWNTDHQLLRIGLQGRRSDVTPPRNLVFLLDVSGSMDSPNKLPLVKRSMQLLLSTLGKQDRVAIVVYAGHEGLVLPSTAGDRKELINETIELLQAAGSTHASAGIQLAYKVACENFKKGAINRVILCTDGDFNVGLTGGSLTNLIEMEREHGIFLTVLGFGTGNLKDDTMENLADKGNGNYAYVDSLLEAHKVLVRESSSTLETIAKDVKLQIEFNPKRVHEYRLIAYENRRLNDEDFSDDRKDAGEMGAGHRVTALYELAIEGKAEDSLRYQNVATTKDEAESQELALVKIRFKAPTRKLSELLEIPISDTAVKFADASQDFRFAASVAAFGLLLSDSEFKGLAKLSKLREWAGQAIGPDPFGERREFLNLIELVESLERIARKD